MAMALTSLVGLSIEDILAIETAAIATIKTGGKVISWSSAGTSVTKQLDGSPSEVLQACTYAKKKLLPGVYGTFNNVTRVTCATGGTVSTEED